MDDRDKDLTHLFVRDLDEIPLPARGARRRAPGRENIVMGCSRYFHTAGAVVAVLAIALLIGLQLSQRQRSAATPSASPTPSASGATIVNPSQSASATAAQPSASGTPARGGAVYNDDFGFIVGERNTSASIRNESSNARLGSFNPANSLQAVAVSPDGKQVAYFAAGASGGPQQLRTFPAAGNATEQTLVTLAAGARGGSIVWSSDGAAVLYSTETGSFGISAGPNSSTLNIYELAANGRHGTTIDSQNNTGWLYRPIGWDRSADLAAAAMTGEGGFMSFYVTVRTTPDNSFTVNRADLKGAGMAPGRASSDAKVVVAALSADTVAYWPLADVTARKTTRTGTSAALWQPGTHKFGYISADGAFILFQTDDGSATTVFTGVKSFTNVAAFRADGSAVLLAAHEAPAAGSTDFTLYRLSDGTSVTFQELVGLIASVRFR